MVDPSGARCLGITWQAINVPEAYDPGAIARDLAECRARGLDWLDHKQSNQRPVSAAELQRLAKDYVEAIGAFAIGRIAMIKVLLQHGIAELARQGQAADANLLRDLFFGDGNPGTIIRAGELLKIAQRNAGERDEGRFRERRLNVMRAFAGFLITFTVNAGHEEQGYPAQAQPEDGGEATRQLAATGFVGDNEHFVQMLADASKATIVGITNERLLPMLTEALRRKRASGRPDAFWDSLRIVFLAEGLLGAINDERELLDDRDAALRQRRQEAFWARRLIGIFLKRTRMSRWELFESRFVPELTGSLLEFGNRRVVHLVMRRPRRPTAGHLYVDLEDRTDHFSAVFEDIVRDSASDNMIVPIGEPSGATFQCYSTRAHATVLKDDSMASGWLPMILLVTYRHRDGQTEPVLRLRTAENAAREENRLSHIVGHILQADRLRAAGHGRCDPPRTLDLMDDIPLRAAERLAENVTGIDSAESLRAVTTGRYLYPDKEHLFFFIYALELPEWVPLPRRAEMRSFSLPELLAIRADQVLGLAAELCRASALQGDAWTEACEVLALNLILHDRRDLAAELRDLAGRLPGERAAAADRFSGPASRQTAPQWASGIPLRGLAGWHYREFFSVLLPLYARAGVSGAAELDDLINGDDEMRSARDRLAQLYQDEDLIRDVRLEL